MPTLQTTARTASVPMCVPAEESGPGFREPTKRTRHDGALAMIGDPAESGSMSSGAAAPCIGERGPAERVAVNAAATTNAQPASSASR